MKSMVLRISHHDQTVGKVFAVFTAIALTAASIKPFGKLIFGIPQNSRRYLTQSSEELNVSNYGDCNSIGYGYIRKIIPSIPDPNLFPVTRYSTYNLYPSVLFSDSRYHYDDRILVGIDLISNDTQEAVISEATVHNDGTDPTQPTWTFQTGWDYDLLTGFMFHFADKPRSSTEMTITLYDSAKNFVQIGKWTAKAPDDLSTFSFRLEHPIEHFSFGRGGTDFVLKIENTAAPQSVQISGVEVLGVKVDLSGYTIFQRDFNNDGRCFAAIKNSFLQEIQQTDSTEWKRYLREVSNVSFDY